MGLGPRSSIYGGFRSDERGSTAIEYSLIVGMVFLVIVAGVKAFSAESGEMFDEISSAIIAG